MAAAKGPLIFVLVSHYRYFSDSLYLALAADSLDELVKPDMREEWELVKQERFPRPEHKAFDKRTPGKLKANYVSFTDDLKIQTHAYNIMYFRFVQGRVVWRRIYRSKCKDILLLWTQFKV